MCQQRLDANIQNPLLVPSFLLPNPTLSAEMYREESCARGRELNQGKTLSAEAVCYLWWTRVWRTFRVYDYRPIQHFFPHQAGLDLPAKPKICS